MASAATALRLLSPRSAVLGAGNGDSLQNVNTTELPDGSLCFVTGVGLYELDKTSAAPPLDTLVVAPGSGPGRWIFLVASTPDFSTAPARSSLSVVSTGATVATGGGQSVWTVFPTAAYDSNFDPTLWSFDSATGVLTYLGPSRRFEVTAYLNTTPSSSSIALIGLDIDISGSLVGTTDRTVETMEAETIASTSDHVSLATSCVAPVITGNTVRAVARNAAAAVDIVVHALTLIVRPF